VNDVPADMPRGERVVSPVAATPWLTARRKALMIGVGTAAILGIIYLKNPGAKKEAPSTQVPPTGMGQVVQYEAPKPLPIPLPLPAGAQGIASVPPAPFVPVQSLPEPKPLLSGPRSADKTPRARMLSFGTTEPKRPSETPAAALAGDVAGGAPTGTTVTYKPTAIPGAKAGAAIDKTLVLMPGLIRCILDVQVNSQHGGPLMCHLPDPVISDGNVVLMEKGSQIFGTYSSEVRQGQDRLLAVSATGWTPNGIPVPLGGPFADSLGATGLPGSVDNHYVERFGGAVLLTLLEGGLNIAQAEVSKGGNSYINLNTGGGVGSLAQEVLRNTINIPPTITKYQGDEVYIWILNPIDFSAAYKLTTR
jgi:type IV secretion system protein VirB10